MTDYNPNRNRELEELIEEKQAELNKVAGEKGISDEEVLQKSQELDKIIMKAYRAGIKFPRTVEIDLREKRRNL